MTDMIIATHHLPIFDNVEVKRFEFEPLSEAAQASLARFMTLTPADLGPVARHVFSYVQDRQDPDDALTINTPEDVWSYVSPSAISVEPGDVHPDRWYVAVEANVPWEVEHGLHMVWENGTDIVRVGPVDGHISNVWAYDDDRLADVVYKALNPEFTTRRTG